MKEKKETLVTTLMGKFRRKLFNWLMKTGQKEEFIDTVLQEVVDDAKDNSPAVQHALMEFDYTWGDEWKTDEVQTAICNNLVEMLSVFGRQGHTNVTRGYFMHLFKSLIMLEPISQLKFTRDEFFEKPEFITDDGFAVYQNRRMSSVFMKQYGDAQEKPIYCTYLDAFHLREDYSITCDISAQKFDFKETENHFTYHGGMFLLTKDNKLKWVCGAIIKDTKKFDKEKSFLIPVYNILVDKLDWEVMLAFEQDCDEFLKYYDFETNEDYNLYEDTKVLIDGKLKDFSAVVEHMIDMACAHHDGAPRPGLWDEEKFDKDVEEAVLEQVREDFDKEMEEAIKESVEEDGADTDNISAAPDFTEEKPKRKRKYTRHKKTAKKEG